MNSTRYTPLLQKNNFIKWWPFSCKNKPWLPLMQCSTHTVRQYVLRVWGLSIPYHWLIPKSTQLAQFLSMPGEPLCREGCSQVEPTKWYLGMSSPWVVPQRKKRYKMLTTFKQRALIWPFYSIPSLQGERSLYFKKKKSPTPSYQNTSAQTHGEWKEQNSKGQIWGFQFCSKTD